MIGWRAAWAAAALAFLPIYTTWVWAGLRPTLHIVAVAVAAGLLAGLVAGGGRRHRVALVCDPVFWLGLAFLGYLSLLAANAGRALYFDVGYQRWTYAPPPWPRWPSSFARADAIQMLTWFFPAWVIVLAVRAPCMSPHTVLRLLWIVVGSAGFLALFGLVQFATHATALYWTTSLSCGFFASFAYTNHAAAFFVLAGALAAGLLFRDLFGGSPASRWRMTGLASALVLSLIGANLSLSRAGVILAWSLASLVACYGLLKGWRHLSSAGRLNFVAATVGAVGVFYFAVAGFGDKAIAKEFRSIFPADRALCLTFEHFNALLAQRPTFARAALAMWRDHPWLGVGGWGFKYLIADYVPQAQWERLTRGGWANVHCDPLQFLVEFGAVGAGLLFGTLAVLLRAATRRNLNRDALWAIGHVGLALVVVFSLIDLPFRCPAILYTWVLVLAALPKVCGATRATSGPDHGHPLSVC